MNMLYLIVAKVRKYFLFFSVVVVSSSLLALPLINKSDASTLGETYFLLERMQTSVETGMTIMLTPGSDFENSEVSKTLRIYFPPGETGNDEWCLNNDTLSVEGVSSSPIDVTDWAIQEAMPGTLVANCHKGTGEGNDYIEITGIDNLLGGTSYGLKIEGDGDVFKTGQNSGGNLISIQLIEGSKVENISFEINLLLSDRVAVGAYVLDAETITCNVGDNVNLGVLYLGGSYVTGEHSLSTSASGSGFYWTVWGQNAGLSHTSEEAIISSLGVDGVVDLITGEGLGLLVSSSTLGTIQPNYEPTTPGLFGEIDTEANLILASDTYGSGHYNITVGARAGVGAVPGAYQESLTYVCGGYIEGPVDYSCYMVQAAQTQPIHTDDIYNYSMTCENGFDWETILEEEGNILVARDNITGLYWSRPSTTAISHSSAFSYCEGLDLNGHTDWYLPTKDEMMQLAPDPCTSAGCAGSYGGNDMYGYSTSFTTTNWFWTANDLEEDPSQAWWIGIFDGRMSTETKTNSGHARVRCARRN